MIYLRMFLLFFVHFFLCSRSKISPSSSIHCHSPVRKFFLNKNNFLLEPPIKDVGKHFLLNPPIFFPRAMEGLRSAMDEPPKNTRVFFRFADV